MSHEIRTPLGIISGFADLALDPASTAADRDTYLRTVTRNSQNLTNLIGEILDLAKVEAGKINLETVEFSLPSLMMDLVEALSLHAKAKGLLLTLKFEGPFPEMVGCDPTRVRQVLMNLINNALKFTEVGSIEVTASASSQESSSDPIFIQVLVRDSGVGIPSLNQIRLFEPFMQADSSTTRKFGGTGLGLTLSKQLAEALGGGLSLLASTPAQGSTFCFKFQVLTNAKTEFKSQISHVLGASTSTLTPSFSDELRGMKILIVEDSTDNQFLFQSYLTKVGARVEVASDGVEGVAKAQQHSFDAILMDVQMPNLDGYGATKKLRELGLTTPIIALTAHALKEDRDRALVSGFSGYLIKPLNPSLLIESLVAFRTFSE